MLRKRLTYDGLIAKYNKFEILLPDRVAADVMNDLRIEAILDNTNDELLMLKKKQTQKDYVLQNHDFFPDMYQTIEAEARSFKSNYKNKLDQITQTVRYVLKDIPTPYSSVSSSSVGKKSSPPRYDDDDGDGDYTEWYKSLLPPEPSERDPTPQPTPLPTPLPTPQPTPPPTPPPSPYRERSRSRDDSSSTSSIWEKNMKKK